MGTHNYSTESYNDNIQILKNSISRINQTILPSDPCSQFSMAYSVEVASFNGVLSDLQEICTKTVSAYEKAKGEVCVADADSAAKMADPISDLATLTNTLNNITSVMSGTNTGGQMLDFTQCITTVNQLTYEGIVGIDEPDFENMSDEDAKYYYDYYMNIPEDQLTDENRRQIERYLEHLKSKYNIDDNVTEEEKRFIDLYEKIHADEAESMNTFFGKSSQDGITEYDKANIKFIAYTSEGDYHIIFFRYIGECQVNDWNYSGTSCYDFGYRGVYINLSELGLSDPDGAYTTVFHELGHNIDDLLGHGKDIDSTAKNGYTAYFTRDELSDEFFNIMYSDLRNTFASIVDKANNILGKFKLNDESKQKVVEALLDGRKQLTTLNPYEWNIYNAVKEAIQSSEVFQNYGVSDIVGGLTNNTVAGYDTPLFSGAAGVGHPRSSKYDDDGDGWNESTSYYWYKGNEATYKQLSEFWAEYTSYLMTGQQNKVEQFRMVLPNACKMIDEAISEESKRNSKLATDEEIVRTILERRGELPNEDV